MSISRRVDATIFREYVNGCDFPPEIINFPAEIINSGVKEFHFILAFASENYDDKRIGDGNFTHHWNHESLSPEKIKTLKDGHENVKVVISIGGRGSIFNPNDIGTWLRNAKSSIQNIIDDYDNQPDGSRVNIIDGIDVYYENILSSLNDFVYCIGNLITYLKDDVHLNLVSIAPSKAVEAHYKALYDNVNYRHYINWVDYKFYDHSFSDDQALLVIVYTRLAVQYPSILIAGFSTDPRDNGNLPLPIFLGACRELLRSRLLPGISVFHYILPVEKIAQDLIVDSNNRA